MALNLQNKYPGRFDPVSADYPQGKFKNRSSPTAQDGSYMERDWLNDWAGFFGALLSGAGVTPNGNVDTARASQIYDALLMSIYPVGAPIPWPTAVPPAGFIAMTGQSFSSTAYPKLALAYPSLVLPDMRAEFIRGWDNARGVDSGRAILSAAVDRMRNLTGSIGLTMSGQTDSMVTGVFALNTTVQSGSVTGVTATRSTVFDASRQVSVGADFAPRSIAFNYIVRAA